MTSREARPIREILTELADGGKPFKVGSLTRLSHLSREELHLLEEVWPAIEVTQRRLIIGRLVEMSQDSVELDFEGLFRGRLKDEDEQVRSRAIDGLWESEDASLVGTLIGLLEKDVSERVQAAAATALDRFVTLAEEGKLRASYTLTLQQALIKTVRNQDKALEVRRPALESLASLETVEVTAVIKDAYASGDPKLKVSAVYAMGRNCDRRWLPIVLREMESADAEMRFEAAGAAGELGDESTIPHLAKLAKDTDVDVRLGAIEAMGEIGGAEAKQQLQAYVKDRNEAVREAALAAISEVESSQDPLASPGFGV